MLRGLHGHYNNRAEYQTAQALGEQLLALAQQAQDTAMLLAAHYSLGATWFWLGAPAAALTHLDLAQGIALYDPTQHRTSIFQRGDYSGVMCLNRGAWALWLLAILTRR